MKLQTRDLDAIATAARDKFSIAGDVTLKIMQIDGSIPRVIGTFKNFTGLWARVSETEFGYLWMTTVEVYGPKGGFKGTMTAAFDHYGIRSVHHSAHVAPLFWRNDPYNNFEEPNGEWRDEMYHTNRWDDRCALDFTSKGGFAIFKLLCDEDYTKFEVVTSDARDPWDFVSFFRSPAWAKFIELYPSAEQEWGYVLLDDADRVRLKMNTRA